MFSRVQQFLREMRVILSIFSSQLQFYWNIDWHLVFLLIKNLNLISSVVFSSYPTCLPLVRFSHVVYRASKTLRSTAMAMCENGPKCRARQARQRLEMGKSDVHSSD